jgi:hypothetical protein
MSCAAPGESFTAVMRAKLARIFPTSERYVVGLASMSSRCISATRGSFAISVVRTPSGFAFRSSSATMRTRRASSSAIFMAAIIPSCGPRLYWTYESANISAMKRLVLTFSAITAACGGDDAGGGTTTDADTANADSTGDETSATVTVTDSTGPGDGSGGTTLTADGSSSGGGTDTGTSAESGGSTGSGDSTTGAPAELLVEIGGPQAFMDCMPIVPADPLSVSFTLDFDNQGGAVTAADVTAARFSSGGVEQVAFEISPATFGPFDPGETTSEAASKVDGTAMPSNGCDTVECGGKYDFEIEFDVDGAVAMATTSVTVECAF